MKWKVMLLEEINKCEIEDNYFWEFMYWFFVGKRKRVAK